MYSAEEAARILGLQVRTVRNYVREGRLPGVRIGKQYRIARADLEAFTAGVSGAASSVGAQVEEQRPVRASPEVSSVVQIDGIGGAARERLERTLAAVTVAAGEGSRLRVEPLYDDERRRLRLIIVGDAAETAELLRIIDRFSGDGDGEAPARLTAPDSPGAW
jgi:excisionase family DNA binding protein